VPGDYDGDGRTDLVIYDTNTGMWYIYCMSGAYYDGLFWRAGRVADHKRKITKEMQNAECRMQNEKPDLKIRTKAFVLRIIRLGD